MRRWNAVKEAVKKARWTGCVRACPAAPCCEAENGGVADTTAERKAYCGYEGMGILVEEYIIT